MVAGIIGFLLGVLASLVANGLSPLFASGIWPILRDWMFTRPISVAGRWDIVEEREGKPVTAGRITLRQRGCRIDGQSERKLTREGKESIRQFLYKGRIIGNQLTLLFEDKAADGFDSGSYIFIVHNSRDEMHGMATFFGKKENRIFAEDRKLVRVLASA